MLLQLLTRLVEALRRRADDAYCRSAVGPEDMPGHPEHVRPTGDPVTDSEFWDTAEALLDDPQEPDLAAVAEKVGWLR